MFSYSAGINIEHAEECLLLLLSTMSTFSSRRFTIFTSSRGLRGEQLRVPFLQGPIGKLLVIIVGPPIMRLRVAALPLLHCCTRSSFRLHLASKQLGKKSLLQDAAEATVLLLPPSQCLIASLRATWSAQAPAATCRACQHGFPRLTARGNNSRRSGLACAPRWCSLSPETAQ